MKNIFPLFIFPLSEFFTINFNFYALHYYHVNFKYSYNDICFSNFQNFIGHLKYIVRYLKNVYNEMHLYYNNSIYNIIVNHF